MENSFTELPMSTSCVTAVYGIESYPIFLANAITEENKNWKI